MATTDGRLATGRRGILRALLAVVLVGSAGRPRPAAAAAPGFHLVNGWILTDRDVAALGAPGR